MGILLYQAAIVATLILTRILAPNRLSTAGLIWTGLTVINVFWPPLIILQLVVIWGTIGCLARARRSATSTVSPPAEPTGGRQDNARIAPSAPSLAASPAPVVRQADAAQANGRVTLVAVPRDESQSVPGIDEFAPVLPEPFGKRASSPGAPKTLRTLKDIFAELEAADIPSLSDSAMDEIQAAAIAMRIPSLVHFTRAGNLESILKHGLCSISKAGELGIKPQINDHLRLDGYPAAISLSIAFPNHRMFYSYRQKEPDEEWVVLMIDPAVLWQKHCAFCQRNAADHRIRDLPRSSLMRAGAFRSMFEGIEGVPSRREQRLMDYDPTDPQAEVLVFQSIEPDLIGGVAFESQQVLNARASLLGDRVSKVFEKNTGLFGTRSFARNARS